MRPLIRFIDEYEVSSRLEKVSNNTELLGSRKGRKQLRKDINATISEMVKDQVEGILLLERTGRLFLPLLRKAYRQR